MTQDTELLDKDHNNTPDALLIETDKRVKNILDKHFPDHLSFENGSYTISFGSTQIMIIVRPFTKDDTAVECLAQLVTGANINMDTLQFLLRKNAEVHFGAFGLMFDDTIIFSHSITGTHLDENELIATLKSVAVISDYYDDEIIKMAGGKRSAEVLDEGYE